MKNSMSLVKFLIFLIMIVFVGIIVVKYTKDDNTKTYIEIWYDTTFDSDIDLYSEGNGSNEKIYLGAKPIHYIVEENGSLYMKQEGMFKNKETGEVDPDTVIFIRKLSESELKKLKKDIKKIVENKKDEEGFPVNFGDEFWYIKINDKTTRVKAKLKINIIDTYF